jgi:hypothetical protein
MIERRTVERIQIKQLAQVCVDGIRGCHPCRVVNIRDGGAMLHSDTHHTAAFQFDLSLDGFKTKKHCRVIWRNGNTCGAKFVDQSEARARARLDREGDATGRSNRSPTTVLRRRITFHESQ